MGRKATWAGKRVRTLYINTPFLLIQTKSFEGSMLAQPFDLIYELISSIISCARITFGIFIWRPLISHVDKPLAYYCLTYFA